MVVPGEAAAFAVGRSAAWCRLVERATRVAPLGVTVLIRGETGSGKDVVARLIVALGNREGAPFVAVNCAALPDTLVESELFGHARGSFSGATEARRGLFEEAHRGTLFLDEIGALPLSAQAKLLRVLEEGRVRRVGENRVTDVRVRVLAATSLDMEAAIGRREFREDLYYRLSALELLVPPLRERPEDIPLLAEHFLRKLREQGGPERTLSPEALDLLTGYPFPGNVRELKHAVEQAAVFGDGPILEPTDFRALWGRSQMLLPASEPRGGRSPIVDVTSARLEEALRRTGGNRLEAARLLGISRSSFYRILRRLPAAEAPQPD
ncbi:MAG TPA: sigma-54 dependent transcriptional regulator [Thermoanaerobaculia bacterium]|nr:sigma-54 dependent transcriptional regulator [Thermoanaerobaculia bacterium]HQN06188.1 sigma-54 dependent transcriptional regulator [Thermoanaerobaculia bacterium]HQP87338.1 sigma-54 dependent transcriptional regulator [Thermoanaerobaculia bacterium]